MAEAQWWDALASAAALDREAIASLLPHRGHMALLDRAAAGPGDTFLGEVGLRDDAFWVAGHFPVPAGQPAGRFTIGPIYPGVLMVESSAQLGICFWRTRCGVDKTEGKLMVFKEIEKAIFKREARVRETIFIRAGMEKCGLRMMRCNFEGVVRKADGMVEPCFSCTITGLAV